MSLNGGLKLDVAGASANDRRVRAARVVVARLGGEEANALLTDARGRLRYPLAAGEYRLELADGGDTEFTVADGRWTSVRVRLP
jgi:hypothetical protein